MRRTLCVCFLTVSLMVSAIEMFEGDFILLLCNYPTFNLDQPKVVWTRSGLSPSTVHKLQLEGDPLKDQNQLYRGRTFMETNALETGELNLNLTNLQLSDTGTYTCSIQDFREEQRVTDIELLVKEAVSHCLRWTVAWTASFSLPLSSECPAPPPQHHRPS
uniref:Ig-like domain-containing protein n=1 Tax=Fundulus heteroclitus TaxID=8078 RepID=A0A3Q2P9M0_FUNHE